MVMFPNGGISDGNGSKRILENGYLSPSSGDAPKFKVRKVSATRQFPDMCGHEFQHFRVEPEETVAVTGGGYVGLKLDTNGGVTTGTGLQNPPYVDKKGYLETDGEGTSTSLEQQEKADLLFCETVGKGCETNGAQILPLEAWQNHLATKDNESEKLVNSGGWQNGFNGDGAAVGLEIPDVEMEIEVEAQSHEVVGSAVLEEGNESVDMLIELVDEGSNQVFSEIKYVETESVKDHERKGTNMELPKEVQPSAGKSGHGEVESLAKRADEDGVKPYSEGSSLIHGEASALSPKNKFSRKRVPAKRDFPKYCGLDALAPPAEEDQNVVSEKFLQGVYKVSKKNALEVLDTKAENASSEKLRNGVEVCDVGVSVVSNNVAENGTKDRENDHVIDTRACDNVIGLGQEGDHVIVNALVAAKNCPWRQHKVTGASGGSVAGDSANRVKPGWRGKVVAKKTISNANARRLLLKKMPASTSKHPVDTSCGEAPRDEGKANSEDVVPRKEGKGSSLFEVNVINSGPSSSNGDARSKVRDVLRTFQTVCRKLLQGEESRFEEGTKAKASEKIKRIDLEASKILKEKGKEVNVGTHFLGHVPGVEVGDEFQYRVELAIVGIHRLYQGGIDYTTLKGKKVATSIVASGGYDDDLGDPNVLIYSGQGGNPGKDKQPEDQKLERGNLALWNSKSAQNPIRVVRGSREKDSDTQDKSKMVTKYVYDGLYKVEDHWKETGEHGKLVYMFKLKRVPGQPEVACKEFKASKKARVRHGVCVDDVAGGKELYPIGAVNTIDDGKPPPFTYIKKVMYPKSLQLPPVKGCICSGKCSSLRKCSCALRNGGEIPYNRNGAIVEIKSIVYECGPHCKCPPSCYNRVSQSGIKLPLEIFKTESRGWGVRALSSISSGSFICEYAGEILDDKEAEKRTSDEYLFDIGQKYSDSDADTDAGEEGSFTIDALRYGNVGRFINHSCSPNLYAQNVIYDHDDKRVPHIMLFAAENIPPLQELTYDYNYVVGQVHDSNGNVKVKNCYCGATGCTGRMY